MSGRLEQILDRETLRRELRHPANQLTAARLALIPVLWALALGDADKALGLGLAAAYLTDILDGIAARRSGSASEFGAAFDSLADNLLLPSAIGWMILLRPQILSDQLAVCLLAIGLYTATLATGWLKFGQVGNLHLYSSKVGSVVLVVFFVQALLAEGYSVGLFWAAAGCFILSSLETLVLQLLINEPNAHLGSIVHVIANKG